jgi:hypothetical protein
LEFLLLGTAMVLLGAMALLVPPASGDIGVMPELPKLPPERWVNTEPLERADFAGQVVLIEIWTST